MKNWHYEFYQVSCETDAIARLVEAKSISPKMAMELFGKSLDKLHNILKEMENEVSTNL